MTTAKGPQAPLDLERMKRLHTWLQDGGTVEAYPHALPFGVSATTLGRAALGLPVKRASLGHLERAIDAIAKVTP